ncbi:hypothetical protein FNH22_31705 [Fulvivirga sp. M361]|uniref:hypothetical protein n=1 Tax=Fulvivirga sp. M361 TaxID=2594266 RepID=UPI00117B8BC9|nr:hypothetical protein [Fulvivirga sp. M361]TRX44908.1 hypothetical protein FNH22_31705 [Fulvivirga sp. M361]
MAGKITIQLPMKMVQYKGGVSVLSVHRKQEITLPLKKKNAMDTPEPYDQLCKAVRTGETESIFKCLEKIESAKVRTRIISLIFDDVDLYELAQCALKPHRLEYVVRQFCHNLQYRQTQMFVNFSCKGYATPLEELLSAEPARYEEIKSRLYTTLIHLCAHVKVKNGTFILVDLYSTQSRLSVSLDTDVPFLHSIDNSNELPICMALNHIRQMGGKLHADCIGLSLKLFRLTLTLDFGCNGNSRKPPHSG